jgi:hypothetical protein
MNVHNKQRPEAIPFITLYPIITASAGKADDTIPYHVGNPPIPDTKLEGRRRRDIGAECTNDLRVRAGLDQRSERRRSGGGAAEAPGGQGVPRSGERRQARPAAASPSARPARRAGAGRNARRTGAQLRRGKEHDFFQAVTTRPYR